MMRMILAYEADFVLHMNDLWKNMGWIVKKEIHVWRESAIFAFHSPNSWREIRKNRLLSPKMHEKQRKTSIIGEKN